MVLTHRVLTHRETAQKRARNRSETGQKRLRNRSEGGQKQVLTQGVLTHRGLT